MIGRMTAEGEPGPHDLTVQERPGAKRDATPASIEERYELLGPLGRGGMGEVLAARDRVLGRQIAIKRMLDAAPSPRLVARFLREARIQGWLDHPAIPPVHELALDREGQPYFVMKRLAGKTLGDVLQAQARGETAVAERYPRERLLRAFAEVCLAVEFAHTRGDIHRDLKPSNIMLGEFGEVFVLDWGVAKLVGGAGELAASAGDATPSPDMTQAGAVIGTPSFMAPEQLASSADLDARADVFALGRVLRAILRPSVTVAPEDARAADPDVPPELDELVRAATAHDRDARIATARELGDRLQRYLDGDRDRAERRRLAAQHLERARAALATHDGRSRAMHEAGRALALDPTMAGAAELVGRLMLEPPREVPAEVTAALADEDARAQMAQARRGRFTALLCAVLLPATWWVGVREPAYYVAIVAAIAALVALTTYGARHPMPVTGVPIRAVVVILVFATMIFILARLFSPFLIAPGAAILGASVLVGAPAYRNPRVVPIVIGLLCAAFIVPALAEMQGWMRSTFSVDERALTITAPSDDPHTLAPIYGLLAFASAGVAIITLQTLARVRSEQRAQRQLYLHAWQLRQLVALERRPVSSRG